MLREPVPSSLRAYLAQLQRSRLWLYALLAITFLAAFNGQWRIGRDSAAYRWIAIATVSMLGLNSFFLEHANEILTDVPFLLGVVLALYGFEKLTLEGALVEPLATLTAGLLLAASMRPTFWFLALAWAGACG